MTTRNPLVLVQFETGNFTFTAYAWTEAIGREMLRQAWATHVAQTGADPVYLDEFYDDVSVHEVNIPGVLRDGSPVAVGDVHGCADGPSLDDIFDFVVDRRLGHDLGPDRTEFNMDEVCALLHYHLGVRAYVEYTGGGCATIYAGSARQVDGETFGDGTPVYRYPCLGGPGWFTGPMGGARTTTVGDYTDFYVGPDDETVVPGSLADMGVTNTRQIAALIALNVIDAADFDNVTAIGLDGTQRGIPQNGA